MVHLFHQLLGLALAALVGAGAGITLMTLFVRKAYKALEEDYHEAVDEYEKLKGQAKGKL